MTDAAILFYAHLRVAFVGTDTWIRVGDNGRGIRFEILERYWQARGELSAPAVATMMSWRVVAAHTRRVWDAERAKMEPTLPAVERVFIDTAVN